MTDDQTPDSDDTTMSPEAIRNLRSAADEGKKAKAEAEEARRELAFVKAGINTEDKVGRMLYATYDGELDAEAIKSAADGLPDSVWMGSAPAQPASSEPAPGEVIVPGQQQSPVGDPHAIGGRASFEQPENEPAFDQMKRAYRDAQQRGGTDDAIDAALSVIAHAAKAGDPQVIATRQTERK